ncbi:HAMP domain-containing protein [Candidatus Electrothrix marina]|uniref:histidine kinase n=1 Tax=Candidatus Electrothrix marina TaxID=1859130 RepID=A0A444JGH3_9BACT|nr:HAMP domain-containing protein [Candidatus Electrothrix marina]
MKLSRISLRMYLVLMNSVLLCLLFPLLTFIFIQKTADFRDEHLRENIGAMRKGMENRSAALVRSIGLSVGQAAAGYDFTFLSDLMAEVVKNDREMVYCLIMDDKRQVLAHPDKNKLGTRLDDKMARRNTEQLWPNFPKMYSDGQVLEVSFLKEQDVLGKTSLLEAVLPVYNGDKLWGILRCGYTMHFLNSKMIQEYLRWDKQIHAMKVYFISMMAVLLLISVFVAVLFTRPLLRALDVLRRGVHQVRDGDLEHKIRKDLVCNEFSDLADLFNGMTISLGSSRKKLADYNKSLENKVDERTRELKEAQDIMIRQAHEAGMAEMAVGVLHNIGNAITPAKISAAMLITRLKNSPLRNNLARVLHSLRDMLELSQGDVGEDRSLRMQKIIELIPESIAEEYGQVETALEQICDKHSHIEDIIRLQRQYARIPTGEQQHLDINRVARDALNMFHESLEQREIDVELAFQEVPPVLLEEVHFLQILVNLIKNSYESFDGGNIKNKKIILSSFLEGDESHSVVFSIKDNGCGFTEKERENFFRFGYSTKARGSGFGLHSCANYLIANNGSIDAVSVGPGMGSEFILRLPADTSPE